MASTDRVLIDQPQIGQHPRSDNPKLGVDPFWIVQRFGSMRRRGADDFERMEGRRICDQQQRDNSQQRA